MYRFALTSIFVIAAFIASGQVKQQRATIPPEVLAPLTATGLPYGGSVVKQLPANTNTKANQTLLRNAIDTMSVGFYQDFSSAIRRPIPAKHLPLPVLFASNAIQKQRLVPVADTCIVQILKVSQRKGFSVYSAMVQQDIACTQCEYQPRQLINVLFTVAGHNIVGTLIIAYINGDDIERRERYCYIDQQGNIFLKDFLSDELHNTFLKSEKWYITPKGAFKKSN